MDAQVLSRYVSATDSSGRHRRDRTDNGKYLAKYLSLCTFGDTGETDIDRDRFDQDLFLGVGQTRVSSGTQARAKTPTSIKVLLVVLD